MLWMLCGQPLEPVTGIFMKLGIERYIRLRAPPQPVLVDIKYIARSAVRAEWNTHIHGQERHIATLILGHAHELTVIRPAIGFETENRLLRTVVMRELLNRMISHFCFVHMLRHDQPLDFAFFRSRPGYPASRFNEDDIET